MEAVRSLGDTDIPPKSVVACDHPSNKDVHDQSSVRIRRLTILSGTFFGEGC